MDQKVARHDPDLKKTAESVMETMTVEDRETFQKWFTLWYDGTVIWRAPELVQTSWDELVLELKEFCSGKPYEKEALEQYKKSLIYFGFL